MGVKDVDPIPHYVTSAEEDGLSDIGRLNQWQS